MPPGKSHCHDWGLFAEKSVKLMQNFSQTDESEDEKATGDWLPDKPSIGLAVVASATDEPAIEESCVIGPPPLSAKSGIG